ncbi:MAG: hypothetical protein R2941_22415 [Desulfobacterales bacterium]
MNAPDFFSGRFEFFRVSSVFYRFSDPFPLHVRFFWQVILPLSLRNRTDDGMAGDLCRASFREYTDRVPEDKLSVHCEYEADKTRRHCQARIEVSSHAKTEYCINSMMIWHNTDSPLKPCFFLTAKNTKMAQRSQ